MPLLLAACDAAATISHMSNSTQKPPVNSQYPITLLIVSYPQEQLPGPPQRNTPSGNTNKKKRMHANINQLQHCTHPMPPHYHNQHLPCQQLPLPGPSYQHPSAPGSSACNLSPRLAAPRATSVSAEPTLRQCAPCQQFAAAAAAMLLMPAPAALHAGWPCWWP
jgi:hypothetical protein